MSYYTEYSKGEMPLRYRVFSVTSRYSKWQELSILILSQAVFWSLIILGDLWLGNFTIPLAFAFLLLPVLLLKSPFKKIGFLYLDENGLVIDTIELEKEIRLFPSALFSLHLTKKQGSRDNRTFLLFCKGNNGETHEIHVENVGFLEKAPSYFHTTPPCLSDTLRHFASENKIRFGVKS